MPLQIAVVTNHTLTLCAIAVALAFIVGTYGHIIHSRALVLAAIVAIGLICLFFVTTGEIQTFN